MIKTATLLVNPTAGGGSAAQKTPAAVAALKQHGIDATVVQSQSLEHAKTVAKETAQAGGQLVVLGGDGLIGAAADVLRHVPNHHPLGVFPAGRGNDLARVLKIPHDFREGAQLIASGTTRTLDLGEVDGKSFVGIASLGFDSVANRYANEAPSQLGSLAYAYGGLRTLLNWKTAQFELEINEERIVTAGFTIAVANSPAYGGGMFLAPEASLEDGLFDVVVIEEMPKHQFALKLPTVFKGTHINTPQIHLLRAKSLRIRSFPTFTVYADGDPIGETPVSLSVIPKALNIFARP